MPLSTGMVVIIGAVLLFYLRLILIQRERAKRLRAAAQGKAKKKPLKGRAREAEAYASLSILSTRPLDWAIAGAGLLAIVAGIMLNLRWLPWQVGQVYWWLPVALGIVAFSWAFR